MPLSAHREQLLDEERVAFRRPWGAGTRTRTGILPICSGIVLGGPAALALAILAGYLIAAAALRPVDAMRRRAAAIIASTPFRRRCEPRAANPARAVADRARARLAETASQSELEQALRSAAEDTERLIRLTDGLLLIARSDQGELPVRRERISALAVLEDVARRYEGSARARGRSIAVAKETDASVEADPARLEQALGNLIDNAPAYGESAVELFVRPNGDRSELHVLDAGPGFPPGFVPRALDRFSRADEARSPGGGHGADVWITLPRVHEPMIVPARRADPALPRP